MRDPSRWLSDPPRLPLVAASILSADFAALGESSQASIDAGADLLHFDVMDGRFVPNLSMGPGHCRALRRVMPRTFFDVHLMVADPGAVMNLFLDAGADHLTFHIEAVPDPGALIDQIHKSGASVGLAMNPSTAIELMTPFVELVDLILVMSVNPGFSGQQFIPTVLQNVQALKPMLRPDQRLQMDGGVNARTAPACTDAGCDVLVAASAIFGADDMKQAIAELRGSAGVASGG